MTTVSYELQAKGIRGVLVVMAERGLITELRCVMPTVLLSRRARVLRS